MQATNRYRVVTCSHNGKLEVNTYRTDCLGQNESSFIAAMKQKGFKYVGRNCNPNSRLELQGKPKFLGLLGPLWDGDAIRYEDAKAYKQLSV